MRGQKKASDVEKEGNPVDPEESQISNPNQTAEIHQESSDSQPSENLVQPPPPCPPPSPTPSNECRTVITLLWGDRDSWLHILFIMVVIGLMIWVITRSAVTKELENLSVIINNPVITKPITE